MNDDQWQPAPDQVWLVHGTAGAVVESRTLDDEQRRCVAIRLSARLNLDPRDVEDERTYILDAPELVELLAGLMMIGNAAYGSGFMMSAFGDVLGVAPKLRNDTIAAVDRALDGLRP